MKTILLSVLAFGAMTSAALAQPATSAPMGRMMLSDAQMDVLTAGLAGVGILADAFATGDRTFTRTRTRTVARGAGPIDLAIGTGHAFAAGSESSDVDVDAVLISDPNPLVAREIVVERRVRGFSFGFVIGIVVSRP